MHPIFEHTLKKSNGRWDKQALTFFLFVGLTVITGMAIVIASLFFQVAEAKMAYEVFTTFAAIMAFMSGSNITNKWVDYTKARNPQQDPYVDTTYIGNQFNNNKEKDGQSFS